MIDVIQKTVFICNAGLTDIFYLNFVCDSFDIFLREIKGDGYKMWLG